MNRTGSRKSCLNKNDSGSGSSLSRSFPGVRSTGLSFLNFGLRVSPFGLGACLPPLLMALCMAFPGAAIASSILPLTLDRQVAISSAVFRGEVLGSRSFESVPGGAIYTLTVMRVDEVFKGKLPSLIKLLHRGGTLANRGEQDGFAPRFKVEEERLLFLSRRPDGTLYATRGQASAMLLPPFAKTVLGPTRPEFATGVAYLAELRRKITAGPIPGVDLTDQSARLDEVPAEPAGWRARLFGLSSSATNLLIGDDGLSARFILPDRGEPIPYLVDADYLPAGITLTQALQAVRTALAAWTNVTSLRFVFAGLQSFGTASPNVQASDGALRIQLHDHYNYIGGSGDVLGRGGRGWSILNVGPGWTTGGNVRGNDFHRVSHGFVVLEHQDPFMQDITNFTEVLCHEIGHAIGMGHSSENPTESNPVLAQAVMYYRVQGDGRGATLNAFDVNTVRQIHPPDNTPPYCLARVMDVVSAPSTIHASGVNQVQVRGYDLQASALSLAVSDPTTNNGSFSIVNSNFTFVPKGYFSDSPRLDPAGNEFYDSVYVRYSDGANASPFAAVRVISFNQDSSGEGIPDNWRTTYFGSPDPSAGQRRHAADDYDGDGFSNLTEFLLGSDPQIPSPTCESLRFRQPTSNGRPNHSRCMKSRPRPTSSTGNARERPPVPTQRQQQSSRPTALVPGISTVS